MMWKKFSDYFLADYQGTHDLHEAHRVQFTFNACLLTAGFALFYVLVSWFIEYPQGIFYMTLDAIALMAIPFLFRFGVSSLFIANMFVLFCYLPILACSYFSGGIMSPVTPWITIVPMCALLLTNQRWLFFWVFASGMMVITYGVLKIYQVEVAVNYNRKYDDLFYILVFVGLILITLFVNNVINMIKKNALINLTDAKEELAIQKGIIEEKHTEITDSIHYAKRIQTAILPSSVSLNDILNDHFVMFKPKDIVSGDFYWIHETNNKIMFAAIDCTGHGVPGALMSMVGNHGLEHAVNEKRQDCPGKILNTLNGHVKTSFSKYAGEKAIMDGMDVALCVLDRTKNKVQFCGAINPLYLIRPELNIAENSNGDWIIENGWGLKEMKGMKIPIGNMIDDQMKLFSPFEFEAQPDDRLYVFSDGYADQFGGPKGKKFKYKPFKSLLLSIQDIPMNLQGDVLSESFEKWKGEFDQIDDVCVIGVRV